jgi:GGDEF domain-containing protein
MALFMLGAGVTFLAVILVGISQYSDRLASLKNQHVLIKKIIATSLNDTDMAAITINGDIAELALFAKLSNKPTIMDSLFSSDEEESLIRTLLSTSNTFQESALFWVESMPVSREAMYQRMLSARNLHLVEIDSMIDYQIHLIDQSVVIAKITVLIISLFGLITFFLYQWRLTLIYRDITKASSVDTDNKYEAYTEEIDYVIRRLARKMPVVNTNQTLLNPISGINNEKGMLTAYNVKRNIKNVGSLFILLLKIDQQEDLIQKLSKEDMNAIYKKLSEILAMYEQPLDVIAHLENDCFTFVMARNSKESALNEAEKIIASVSESLFLTALGIEKITLSGGIMLKIPSKTLEESLIDAEKLVEKAKESGGNRVAQLRDKVNSYR